ncbi:ATP-dependent DNA helicase MER3 [Psilocybe cubensis]|uniref:ATP-dependent DNA helicase MER3 n=1 Tax=Psilocybe cubensis TaxID=181762 RepID=A0ACB8H9X2_PSICU|nr:ATP-dependent DNA helicase MER3 [Psilocybe cubensis]KAH9483965.1 ATP-dependent DNA helicase MER3 [Psilocybe cubensis]
MTTFKLELASFGIGVHHAGITMDDRRTTEQLFMRRILRILIATSTLAVGVNLPAHMVVIKGVRLYQNNISKEYSDLDIMQMLGRAKRMVLSSDNDGIALILCESELEQKYNALVQGKTVLESSLHVNLAEHINSEIGLGTITDIESAKIWLRGSFLYQRMHKNPKFYQVGSDGQIKPQQQGVEEIIMESVDLLRQTKLITHIEYGADAGKLVSTQYGEIMSKYYIRRATMEIILALPDRASLRDILEPICGADEFQDVKLRNSEKRIFNILKQDPEIRFPVKKVDKTQDKVFILVQVCRVHFDEKDRNTFLHVKKAVLGGISLNSAEYRSSDSQPHMEAFSVFKHIARISRGEVCVSFTTALYSQYNATAVCDVSIVKKDGLQIKNSLELFRCLSAKSWEDRAIVFRQIEQIGEKSIKVLAENGITSFEKLRRQDPLRIETLLNRRAPFGMEVLRSLAEFPQYIVTIKEISVESDGGKSPVQVDLQIRCGLAEDKDSGFKIRKQRGRSFNMTSILTLTSDMDLVDLRRIPTLALKTPKTFEVRVELGKPSQGVIVIAATETVAGVSVQETYKPDIMASEYPTLDTRPLSSVERDLIGLDDDPDFWNMDLDNSDGVQRECLTIGDQIMDTQSRPKSTAKEIRGRTLESNPRADGRFDCNKGLSAPPPPSKKRGQDSSASTARKVGPSSTSVTQKESKVLRELDKIHERTQIVDNLSIIPGKRLKTESQRPSKRKREHSLEHSISFTDVVDRNAHKIHTPPESLSDSDELPEVILSTEKIPQLNNRERTKVSPKPFQGSSSNFKKYNHGGHEQKMKLSTGCVSDTSYQDKDVDRTCQKRADDSLFLASSDSEGSIEIISRSVSPATIHRNTDATPKEEKCDATYEVATAVIEEKSKRNEMPLLVQVEGADESLEQDDFAELDNWLQSGTVDIV